MNSHKQKRLSPRSSKCAWMAKLWLVCMIGMSCVLPVSLVSAHAQEVSPLSKPSPTVSQDVQHKTFQSLYQALLEKFNGTYSETYINQQIKLSYEKPELVDKEFQKRSAQLAFISHVGLNQLKEMADVKNEEFLRWLFQDVDAMDQFQASGAPRDNQYVQALTIWKEIWTKDPDSHKGIYQRLAIAVALEHAGFLDISWYKRSAENEPISLDPLSRYHNFKSAHLAKKLSPVFDTLDVPHMRMVVNALASDSDLDWIRVTYQDKNKLTSVNSKGNSYYHHNIMVQAGDELRSFKTPNQSAQPNQDAGEQSKVHATLKKVLETGNGCVTQANYGTVVAQAHGIPAVILSQPTHETVLFYDRDQMWNSYYYVGVKCQSTAEKNSYIPWTPINGNEDDFPEFLRLYRDAMKNDLQKLILSERFRNLANQLTDKSLAQKVRSYLLTQAQLCIQLWRDLVSNLEHSQISNQDKSISALYVLEDMLNTFRLPYHHAFEELYPLFEKSVNHKK